MELTIRHIENTLLSSRRDGLPGLTAQKHMMPQFRHPVNPSVKLVPAAVFICLFDGINGPEFPLIRRSRHELDRHSDQISLPGGKVDPGESTDAAALREFREELGIPEDSLTILGALSPLPIPVSGFLVHPFVGTCSTEPDYHINPDEVARVFNVPVHQLLSPQYRKETTYKNRNVPYFALDNEMVWGATAMILSEFAEILSPEFTSAQTQISSVQE